MHTGTVASAYDMNGNIKHLKREAGTTVPDNLTYSYTANRLQNITDAGSVTDLFKDVNNALDYDYDLAGNMVIDNNKGVGVKYNYLNLPYEITKTGGSAGKIKHYYVGAAKVRMEVYEADNTILAKTYDYLGGMVYVSTPSTGSELDFIGTPEGRALLTRKVMDTSEDPILSDKFKYEYSLKDHLGNLRVSCRCNEPKRKPDGDVIAEGEPGAGFIALAVVQENHYDPWGLLFGADEPPSGAEGLIDKYGYNGKEQLLDLDLGWNDYGARMYQAEIGRWNGIDPMADNRTWVSAYNYVQNNPINRIDLFGMIDIDGDGVDDGDHNLLAEVVVKGNASTRSDDWLNFIQNDVGPDGYDTFIDEYHSMKLMPYRTPFALTIYGTNSKGEVDIPEEIIERERVEAESESMQLLALLWASEQSGVDPSSFNYVINPIDRALFYNYYVYTGINNAEAKGIILNVGLEAGLAYFGGIKLNPFMKTVKAKGGKVNGISIGTKKGYGAQPRFDIHRIGSKKLSGK